MEEEIKMRVFFVVQVTANDGKHAGKLRENKDAVLTVNRIM